MRHMLKPLLTLLRSAVLTILAVAAQAAGDRPGARIQLEPPRLALLARHVETLGSAAVWDFASITLDALLDSYRQELQDAAREPASTPERRAKLIRWRRATADLAAQIQAARVRLLDGAAFNVYADPQHQVLIVVDGRPIAVSGPRPDADQTIEQRVVQQFCAYNDCSPLENHASNEPVTGTRAAAHWLLGQDTPPTFEIDGVIRCAFHDVTERERKAQACRRLADEALQLATALQQAQRRGYRIDWDWLMDRPPSRASEGQVAVNSDGAYLPLPSRMLARTHPEDWRELVRWLRSQGTVGRRIVVFRQAQRLLE